MILVATAMAVPLVVLFVVLGFQRRSDRAPEHMAAQELAALESRR